MPPWQYAFSTPAAGILGHARAFELQSGRALDHPQGAAAKAGGKARGPPPHNSDVQPRPAP